MNHIKTNSTQIMNIVMYGFTKISKCITNIREKRKVAKSYFCLFGIILGILFGCLTPIVLYPDLRIFFSGISLGPYIIVYIGIVVCSILFGANTGYVLCKFLFMGYNYLFYGNTNEQYSKLSEEQINKILLNNNLNLNRETIAKIDDEIFN
jgi:hypothetical protein